MFDKRLLGGLLALAIAGAACGNNGAAQTTAEGGDGSTAAPATPAAASVDSGPSASGGIAPALLGETDLGPVIIGADGRSLYGFTNDVEAASTCYGACADAWPPVIVGPDWDVGPGLDVGIFATTARDDGQLQLVAGKWPLYYYAGDANPGDLKGQGSGDVWFVVEPNGALITDPASAGSDQASGDQETGEQDSAAAEASDLVSEADIDLGTVLVDEAGLTLYGFTNDADGVPTCNGDCADAWPPMIVDGGLPEGLDPSVFSLVERDDGSMQLVAGKWPLYRFAGDAGPGDSNGQGSGDVWFAAAGDGSLIGVDDTSTGNDDTANNDTDNNDTDNNASEDGDAYSG